MQPASPPVRRVNRTSEIRNAKMPRGFRILGMWIILCASKKKSPTSRMTTILGYDV